MEEPVRSYYYTEGDVRGGCGHKHRSQDTAIDCLERDRKWCASAGGYSDRCLYHSDGGYIDTEYTDDGQLITVEDEMNK